MPVYLFTFHTYRSWMPDHRRGYTRRQRGYLPADPEMARRYRARARHDNEVLLDPALQLALVDEVRVAGQRQNFRVHAVSTEPSHVHALVSWTRMIGWLRVRTNLKSSLSRKLCAISRDQREATFLALSRGASRKRVISRKHFDHLMKTYLVKHSGVKWFEDRGYL